MSPRTFVARSAALFALAALGLAACESKTVVQPAQFPLQIAVTPSSLSFTKAGDKATMVATLTGGDVGQATAGVTWASSNTAVATVDANGVVTAVANGTTTITATSKAVPTLQAAAVVTVNIAGPPVTPPVAAPTISIQSVTDNAGNNVDINNVRGQINVALNVDVPTGNTISSVNVLLDGTVQCSQSFSAGGNAGVGVEAANAVTIVCPISTTKVGANGLPLFNNGPHTITATLVAPGGTIKAQTSQTLTFANVDVVNAAITATKAAQTSNLGTTWVGGDLTVTATPAIFSGTANSVARMTVTVSTFNQGKTATRTDTLASDGLSVTFPNSSSVSNNVSGWEDSVLVTVNTVTTAGQQGPTFQNWVNVGAVATAQGTVTRIDNKAPTVTKFNLPTSNFVNAAFTFGSTGSSGNFNAVDSTCVSAGPPLVCVNGVDRVTATFSAAPLADTSVWKAVTTGADLAEVATPTYIVKVLVTDALGNSKTFYANNSGTANSFSLGNVTAFAVDITPPIVSIDTAATILPGTLTPTSTANAFRSQTTSGQSIAVIFSDTGAAPSGPKGIQYKIIQYTSAGTTCVTFDAANGVCTFGTLTGGPPPTTFNVGATQTATTVPIPSGAGYDSIYVRTVDLASNNSTVIGMLVLQDGAAPAVGGVVGPSVITGGTSVTFSTQASDDVDLRSASANEVFGAVATIAAGSSTIGTFGLPLETSASPAVTLNPFITSLEQASGLGSSTNASAINFTVTDQSRRSTPQSLSIAANVVSQSAFTFTTAIASGGAGLVTAALNATNAAGVCNQTDPTDSGLTCGGDPTTSTLTAVVTGPSGTFANPFARVNFYYLSGGVYQLIGSATSASATDNGTTTRTWSYSIVWTPAGIPAGATGVAAIGVDAKGHGLIMTNSVTIIDASH